MEVLKPGYTRVTEILGTFQNYASISPERLKRAQDIGTDTHAAIESYFNDEFLPVERTREPYIESFFKWISNIKITPIHVEPRLYDDQFMITGKPDLVCEIDGELTLIDFKTGSIAHPEIWQLQGSFYRHLLKASGMEAPNKFIFVQLSREGCSPILFEMDYKEDDWNICQAAMACHRYFRDHRCSNISQKEEMCV